MKGVNASSLLIASKLLPVPVVDDDDEEDADEDVRDRVRVPARAEGPAFELT